ncbi:MAG: GIY-YIG nuclease family protein [Cyclobacteriaceae bacterium]|nr:GIY-YIG nuclease family protein [Cyclobacteriaceae bacterium]
MNCYCYILFSNSLNRFYTGISRELNERILKHNDHSYGNNRFTAKANAGNCFSP